MEDVHEEKRWEEEDASLYSDMSSTSPATPDKNAATGADHHAHNLMVNPLDAAAAAGNEAEQQLLLQQQYQQLVLAQEKVALARQYFDTITTERDVLDVKFNGPACLPDDEYDAQRKKLASLKVTATALLWAAMQEEVAVKQQIHPAVLAALTTTTTTAAAGGNQHNNNALAAPALSSPGQQTLA